MKIGRRELLIGLAASAAGGLVPALPGSAAASATLPASAAEDGFYVQLEGWAFRRKSSSPVDLDAIRAEVLKSVWQYDDQTYEDRPLVRHCPSGLTYLASGEGVGSIAVQQIAAECCPCEQRSAPELVIIGHAARAVAVRAARTADIRREQHYGAVYLRYPRPQGDPRWPRQNPDIEDAPPILVTWLTDPARIASAPNRSYEREIVFDRD